MNAGAALASPRATSALDGLRLVSAALPRRVLADLLLAMPLQRFAQLAAQGFRFYHTTFWYPLACRPRHVFEHAVDALRQQVRPGPEIVGAEWWFSVTRTNATPQWLLPCHFDRADIDEKDLSRVRHPHQASVLFLNAVPYGELVVTDQVLTERGARPRQPQHMRFIRPRRNLYVIFPGHLYHGVIGRLWRPLRDDAWRVAMAVNWWEQPPCAAYMRDSADARGAFGLDTAWARS